MAMIKQKYVLDREFMDVRSLSVDGLKEMTDSYEALKIKMTIDLQDVADKIDFLYGEIHRHAVP